MSIVYTNLIQQMKKLIGKFWVINFVLSIALFFLYRFVFIEAKPTDEGWLDGVLNILDLVLNIQFSMLYLVAMIVSSFTFFLNGKPSIRNNYFLSLLTFSGIPFLGVIFYGVNLFSDLHSPYESPLTTFVIFSVIYLIITTLEFLLFRKSLKNLSLNT